MQYYTQTNKKIQLGKPIDSGGEAVVYRVDNLRFFYFFVDRDDMIREFSTQLVDIFAKLSSRDH